MMHWVEYRELRHVGRLMVVIGASIGFLLLASTSNADTIHVDSTAFGPGDGSQSRPFRTINRAVVTASPGDTLMVKNGSYPEKLAVRKPLTITASDGPVVIEGRAFVRLDIRSLDPNGPEIAALRNGIQVMQSRPTTDPTSWIYQANIHGTPPADFPLRPAWNTCQHGSFFFPSWHRMYVYYFERILRAASGDPFLVLPYWNYSDPSARQLPLPFRQPQDPSNPLFITQRSSAVNGGGSLPGSSVTFSAAFALTNFDSPTGSGDSFGGQRVSNPVHNGSPHSVFEVTPHDAVHVNVGGWMSSFNFAARDPIFWLHHANIDRLWNRWLDQGGGRSNSTELVWLNTQFQFFDETGRLISLSGQDILDTVDLNYMYDDDPPVALAATALTLETAAKPKTAAEPKQSPPRLLATSTVPTVELGSEPVTLSIDLSEEAEREFKAVTDAKEAKIMLNIEGIEFDQIPGGHYEIYINLPEGETPNYKSKYYVGNLTFFGIEPRGEERHKGDDEAARVIQDYNITNAVRELRASSNWTEGKVKITFVRRGIIPPPGIPATKVKVEPVVPVTIRQVTITIEDSGH